MKALITGGGGQLALEIARAAPEGWVISAPSRRELDIADPIATCAAIAALDPDLIFNAAAYTAVDRAECEADIAWRVNRDGASAVAVAAERAGAKLIHVSTDFVFDGDFGRPYQPSAETGPLGVYGASKLAGEAAVLGAAPNALVVRTSWVYSASGSNFLKTMLRLMSSRDEVRVVCDQVGAPTAARDLAAALWRMAAMDAKGVRHFTNSGVASWFDFAQAIADDALAAGVLTRPCKVTPIRTAEYPTPARRPNFSVLDCSETWEGLGVPARHWRAALRDVVGELALTPA